MTEAKILVVEDESIVALNLQNRLKNLGYGVVGMAASGEEAVLKCGATRPDLVLMDIMLQGEMDGVGAAEQIRRNYDVPVVYLTAYADEVTLERAKITEPFGYILKPFEVREIRTTIEIALYKHKMERLLRESEERYTLAVNGANDGIWDWDLLSNQIYYSPRWKAIMSCVDGEITNNPEEWLGRIHPEEKSGFEMAIARHIDGVTSHLEYECRMLAKNGSHRWVFIRGLAVRTSTGKATRMAGSLTDTTRRHEAEEKLIHLATHDPLTDLVSEPLFLEHLWNATQQNEPYAILRFSAPGFAQIYAERGAAAANTAMASIGILLGDFFKGNLPARLYGGEFAVFVAGVRDSSEAKNKCVSFLEAAKKSAMPSLQGGVGVFSSGQSSEDVMREASTLDLS